MLFSLQYFYLRLIKDHLAAGIFRSLVKEEDERWNISLSCTLAHGSAGTTKPCMPSVEINHQLMYWNDEG